MFITKTAIVLGNLLSKAIIKKYSSEKLKNIKANKILIIKSGAIGDVLMTTPFLRALRKIFPSAEINYLVGEESAKVLEDNKSISNLTHMPSKYFHSLNPFHKIKLINKTREKEYDICFILDKSLLANCFALLTNIPIRIGFDRFGEGFANSANVNYTELKHEIDYYLELAYLVGAKEEKNKKLELNLTNEDKKFAEEFFRKNNYQQTTDYRPLTTDHKLPTTDHRPIGISPGGGKNPGVGIDTTRIWPEEKFIKLINTLQKQKIILFGGKQDIELCNRIVDKLNEDIKSNVINISGQTSIKQTAALMQKCSCLITNDAGPMHIASAVNNKVISIFGPTHPLRKAPLHKESKWIWKDEQYYDPRWDIYSTKYAEGKRFMEEITPELVSKEIKRMLR